MTGMNLGQCFSHTSKDFQKELGGRDNLNEIAVGGVGKNESAKKEHKHHSELRLRQFQKDGEISWLRRFGRGKKGLGAKKKNRKRRGVLW